MKEIITKEDMWNYGKINKFYPPWRKPFWKPAFYFSRWLVNHGLKNPQRISYAMILISIIGGTLMISSSLYVRVFAWCLLIFSYFIDMCDGKTSRMLKKDLKGLIGYLDNQFHVPITAYIFFIISLRLYLETNNIFYVLLGFVLPWIFLWKSEMQFSYEVHMLEVKQPEDLTKYEDEMSRKTYHTFAYDTKGIKKWAYVCIRPFLDATDIWFALLPVIIFGLEFWYLLAVLGLHTLLLFYKFTKHIRDLKGEPEKKRNMVDMEQAAKDLKQVNDKIFRKYSLDCWLNYGTLLGAIRDNNFIPWDEDIDLGYIGDEKDFLKLQNVFEKEGWKLFPKYGGIKILNSNHTSKVDISLYSFDDGKFCRVHALYNRLGSVMDFVIWVLSLYPAEYKYETNLSVNTLKKMTDIVSMLPTLVRKTLLFIATRIYNTIGCTKHKIIVPMEYFKPLKPFNFKDVNIFIPNNSEKYLKFLYGLDWRVPKSNWRRRAYD